jgi:hypothetical protein
MRRNSMSHLHHHAEATELALQAFMICSVQYLEDIAAAVPAGDL